MTSKSAAVEVLTAEVRLVAVGSRQITLSVFGQLDSVHPSAIRPFGRVNSRDQRPGQIVVVGSDADGQLCRSSIGIPAQAIGGGRYGWNWPDRVDDEETPAVLKLYEEWCELPLIVLAGLR